MIDEKDMSVRDVLLTRLYSQFPYPIDTQQAVYLRCYIRLERHFRRGISNRVFRALYTSRSNYMDASIDTVLQNFYNPES